MHPLNPFPELLAYSLVAPLLIRLMLGTIYLSYSASVFKKGIPRTKYEYEEAATALVAGIAALMVGVGWYTQIGAILLGLVALRGVFRDREAQMFHIVLGIAALSLLFSGAGFFSFDLPL